MKPKKEEEDKREKKLESSWWDNLSNLSNLSTPTWPSFPRCSLRCRSNLTPVSDVSRQCWNPCSRPPKDSMNYRKWILNFLSSWLTNRLWLFQLVIHGQGFRLCFTDRLHQSYVLSVAQATCTCRIILFTNISDKLFNMKYCLFSQHYSHITEELPVPHCPLLHGCKLTESGVWKLLWWVPWRVAPLVHDGPGSLGSLAFQRLQKEW